MFGKQDPNKPVSTSQQKPQQTFQDIFRELQKKMEETQSKQNIPPYAERKMIPVKEVKPQVEVKKVKPEVNFQQVYQSKDVISDKEKNRMRNTKNLFVKNANVNTMLNLMS